MSVAMQLRSIDLLVLPCAGASATMYMRWRRVLPEWIQLVPVELPGRGGRLGESFVENFDELVTLLCEEHAASLNGCHALFGHSMGALLAYGMAQRQYASARSLPYALFVSGSPAPSRRDPQYFAGKNADADLIADLRKQGGTPEEVFNEPELLRITLDALGADYRVCASFRSPSPRPLSIPIRAFAGRDDDIAADRIDAWREETDGQFGIDWFDGGHFFIRGSEQALLKNIVGELNHRFAGVGNAAGSFA